MSLPTPPATPVTESDTTCTDVNNHSQTPSCTVRCLPDIRSSMPEADLLPTVSSRQLSEKSSSRDKGSERGKVGGLCLPPVPPCATAKLGPDIRKGKKVSSHLEDRTLYSLAVKIAELYDSVKRKRIELGILQRTKTLSTILEAQIPYLDQWFSLEGDYSVSLAEATQALLNASVQLPSSGSVRANLRELEEALSSAIEVMDIIVFHVHRSLPKAEDTEHLISELARVIGGERALIEECGNLLSKTYTTQVEEWSLRSQIIQSKCCCS
ncbi:hypothetical protein ACFXTN_005328 [Malus domestica]